MNKAGSLYKAVMLLWHTTVSLGDPAAGASFPFDVVWLQIPRMSQVGKGDDTLAKGKENTRGPTAQNSPAQ